MPQHGSVMYRVRPGGPWIGREPLLDLGLDVPPAIAGVPGTIVPPGVPLEATMTAVNHARVPVLDARLRLAVPPDWQVQPLAPGRKAVLGTGDSVTGRWRVTPPASAAPGGYRLSGELGARWLRPVNRVAQAELSAPSAPPGGTVDIGDVAFALERGGYGPVERDKSNGSWKPGDGKPLSINGVKYAKGLGGHAPTELVVYLGGACTSFTSDVGIDDERDERMQGSAGFEVWADGAKAADSGVRTWQDDPVTITAALPGARFLRLVINDGGDGNSYDRGDFAGAKLTC